MDLQKPKPVYAPNKWQCGRWKSTSTSGYSRVSDKTWTKKIQGLVCKFYRSVVTKRELFSTAKPSVFKLIFVPILTYGHESRVMTERILSQVQAAEMGFLWRVNGVTLRNKVRSCQIDKTLNIEAFLRIERSQLRWFGHMSRMSQDKLARQVLLAAPTGKWPKGGPRTRWSDYISDLAWPRLGVEPAELSVIACWPWRISRPSRAVLRDPPHWRSGCEHEWISGSASTLPERDFVT